MTEMKSYTATLIRCTSATTGLYKGKSPPWRQDAEANQQHCQSTEEGLPHPKSCRIYTSGPMAISDYGDVLVCEILVALVSHDFIEEWHTRSFAANYSVAI
ncbi:MAG: hypothetical protein IPP17_13985 [Bacteroidetes bacterium]|nr:hypothetical protein [Bacteroidota bacterium]